MSSHLSIELTCSSGGHKCAFQNLPDMHNIIHSNMSSGEFITFMEDPQSGKRKVPSDDGAHWQRERVSSHQLMELTYRYSDRAEPKADGTARSIVEWSSQRHLNVDEKQKVAFQIVTAAFVLTYYRDATSFDFFPPRCHQRSSSQIRRDFIQEKSRLVSLARLRQNQPLRMLLHGPKGSGKSHVVHQVLQYARDYTSRLGVSFDRRTIVVTAMSGVCAASIGGETLYSAAAL